jgi:hypothetical protein
MIGRGMDAPLYHLAGPMLGPGSLILPGNFGRLVALSGPRHTGWDREAALETWRARFYPSLPSRLACVFTFLAPEEARSFRATEPGFGAHRLYRVTVEPGMAHHSALIANFRPRSLNDLGWPDRYWREGQAAASEAPVGSDPAVRVAAELREVLIAGPVRVEACLDGG